MLPAERRQRAAEAREYGTSEVRRATLGVHEPEGELFRGIPAIGSGAQVCERLVVLGAPASTRPPFDIVPPMTRRTVHTVVGCLFGGLLAAAPAAAQDQGAPRNIVFIFTDDQRFDGLGLRNPYFETPRLDRLAEQGILFENAFVTTSLCSPSRASILSGLYAHTHQVLDNSTAMPPDLATFPVGLQAAGYETAFVGKWHMGGASDDPRPGFEHWVSFRGQGPYTDPTLNVNGVRTGHQGYTTDLLTDFAVDFLRAGHERPFLLYLSHKAVHAPFTPADRHRGVYRDRGYVRPASMADTDANYEGKPDWVRRQRNSWHGVDGMYNGGTDFDTFVQEYAEALMAVDDSVGRVVDTLDELGLLESTLLVFMSDNGFQFGEHGLIDKRTMYEASIRVPLIVHCPDLFEGGQRRSEMLLNIDIAPTFLEAGGAPIPETMHGRSFHGLLTGSTTEWRDTFLYEYFWERAFPQTPTVIGVRGDRYKLMRFHGVWDRYELYDLQTDPDEMHNLLGGIRLETQAGTIDRQIIARADPQVAGVFEQLSRRLDQALVDTGALDEPTWLGTPRR